MLETGSILSSIITVVGVYACVQYLYDNLKSPLEILYDLCFRRKQHFCKRYGEWAVITGSSDGIGKEYAKNIAGKGMNIMLLSRTASKMSALAEEIRTKHRVEVKWMAVDFAEGPSVYDEIRPELENLDIGMLVNNVGIIHENPLTLDELSQQDLEQNVSVNVCPTIRLTHMVLPGMKRRRRGIVVNITSASGYIPIPYIQLYAASKAYLNSLTISLQQELRGTGVECQLVTPMMVDTNLNRQWQSLNFWRLITVDVERYARMAVWTIGKVEVTTGYWYHALQLTLLRIPPRWTLPVCKGIFLRYLRGNVFANK
ncbi:inactive hydroxysteroid dehydrogenase-like protein 1 [Wyeomyia smithii]|uniref:inactive hydroxysteroid dehydrogenase-like protein 1 n=1 Tax=Wyeomyia smithii TaxID=174621 RepID=UPI0024682281|nr:inactive hydroxysteroid dehydrogenase-like protein 1 [Wyeomyia smithii]